MFSPDVQFQLAIEGKLGNGELSDIAVDDFVFSPSCRLSSDSGRNCTAAEHQCSDGTCLPLKNRCNFVVECPNGDRSDEEGCVSELCTFEGKDSCNWDITPNAQEKEDIFTWMLLRGDDSASNGEQRPFKPNQDHSKGDSSSYYAFTSASYGLYEASTDLITNLTIGESSTVCHIRLWYWLSGPQPGSLHIQVISKSNEITEAWMVDGNHENKWNLAEVPLPHLVNRKVSIHAHRNTAYVGGAAVDDVEFVRCAPPTLPPKGMTCNEMGKYKCKSGACIDNDMICDNSNDCFDNSDEHSVKCMLYHHRCSFEKGLCVDWIQDIDSTANWVIHKASQDTIDSLPSSDHTYGTTEGSFLKLDGNSGSVSYLHSLVQRGTTKDCYFRMWYQVFGNATETIKIYKRFSYFANGMHLLAEIDHAIQGVWLKFNINLSNVAAMDRYQVVVEGTAGKEGFGHIVLDDFSMTPSCETAINQKLPGEDEITTPSPVCLPGQLLCDNGNCYIPSQSCNFINDCGDGTDERECTSSCDFENGDWCGWFESTSSSIHWAISTFPALPPGPDVDHSNSQNTHDLTTTKSEGNGGQVAILESHTFTSVGRECSLTFWTYLAYEEEPSTLLLMRKAGHDVETLWTAGASNTWEKGEVKVGGKRDFTLHFMATHGKGKTHIAVDDLMFHSCESNDECQSLTDFECAEEGCIPLQFVCDAKYDCYDKSDEFHCPDVRGNCNFDSGSWQSDCKYRQRNDDLLDWQWNGDPETPDSAPHFDHTLGTLGHYVYLSNKSGVPGLRATLEIVDEYPASRGICYLRLWYYMHADNVADNVNIGTLRVYLTDKYDQRYLAGLASGNHEEKDWIEMVIPVNMDENFFVMFEAITGTSEHTFIAVDDVSFTPECETGVRPPPSNNTCEKNETKCNSGDCIPDSFFCDCFVDCPDGSDESNCNTTCGSLSTRSTTTTSTTTTVSTTKDPYACSTTQFPCKDKDHTCIPALLLCDSIPDCPNQADETQCPQNAHCDPGFFYCSDKYISEHPCMRMEKVCNNFIQCLTYAADESVCDGCPQNYCINNGVCEMQMRGKRPTCTCPAKYTGNRCELPVLPTTTRTSTATSTSSSSSSTSTVTSSSSSSSTSTVTSSSSSSSTSTVVSPPTPSSGLDAGAIAGIVFGVLFIIIVGVVGFFYFRTKRRVVQEPQSFWDLQENQHYVGPDLHMPSSDIPLDDFDNTSNTDGVSNQNYVP